MSESITSKTAHFDLKFPDSIALPFYYYNAPYNEKRRCKLIMFGNCIGPSEDLDRDNVKNKSYNIKKRAVKTILKKYVNEDFVNIILSYAFEKKYTREHIVKKLERGCLNRAVEKATLHNIRCVLSNTDFVNLYHAICYKVATNIDERSEVGSNYIKNKILSKSCKISDVPNFTSTELCPKKFDKIQNKINKRTNAEHKKKYSELYKCRKCKKNQTITERRYNRSMDEGVNLMIICVCCGFQWCG